MDTFPFARRTNWRQESNVLNKTLEELKRRHIEILDLTASNPTQCGFKYPSSLLSPLNSRNNLDYQPEACGMDRARQAVADYYAQRELCVPSGDIVLTASTSEAYAFLMRLLVNAGEKVLIPRPSYPLFQFLLEINDVNFEYYPLLQEGDRWCLDTRALEQMVDAKTRAIILVNPNNPTGSYISPVELDFLNGLCRKHHLALISDEVFLEYPFFSKDAFSLTGNKAVLTFTLGGLSKTLALPQMKCAWILASGPQAQLQEALLRLETIADTYLSVNTPVQNALEAWLRQAPALQDQIISRVKANLDWLKAHLNAHTRLLPLQGGWYATLRLPAVKSEEEWAMEFLTEDHVLIYPGYFFDFEGGVHIVLSLLPAAGSFQEAVSRIIKRLDKI